jgi:hypothetical protein
MSRCKRVWVQAVAANRRQAREEQDRGETATRAKPDNAAKPTAEELAGGITFDRYQREVPNPRHWQSMSELAKSATGPT